MVPVNINIPSIEDLLLLILGLLLNPAFRLLKARFIALLNKSQTTWLQGSLFLLTNESKEFTTALDYLQQSLEILQKMKSPDAERVKEIIANVQQIAAEN